MLEDLYRSGAITVDQYASRNARILYLEILSKTVISLAKDEKTPDEPLYLMDSRHKDMIVDDIEKSYPEIFEIHQETIRKFTKIGMRAARNDLFMMITPDTAEDKLYHFMPWRKDIAELITPQNEIIEVGDSSTEIIIPTALSKINVVHKYSEDRYSMPIEEIRLATHHRMDTIPPSSLQ